MKVNHPSTAPGYFDAAGDIRTGKGASGEKLSAGDRQSVVLLEGIEGAADNYMLGYGESKAATGNAWTSPRHHHNFEQIRYVISGDYHITKDEILPAGWVAYFPESAFYGPQIKSANLTMSVLQFGGPSGNGYASIRQQRAGFEVLRERGGAFAEGMYTWVDESGARHNQDASEALWEVIFQKPVEYPSPRYDKCISMNPQSFNWSKDDDLPGVADKWLGTFTERIVRVGFVRVDKGATFRFGSEPAAEVTLLTEGSFEHDGNVHERLSAFGSSATDTPAELHATEDAELFYIKLPTF